MPRPLGLALLLALLFSPSSALAYEDQLVLELGAGYVGSFGSSATPLGARAELGLLIGLSPSFSLGARADGGAFFDLDGGAHTAFVSPLLELVYAIDVVRYVPRFAFGTRAIASFPRDGGPRLDLGLDLALGLDFLPRSGPNYGLELRATFVPLDRTSSLGPVWLALSFRVGFPFER